MLYPISFSIPTEKICNTDVIKTKILSDLIPGDRTTYIYNTEEKYYKEYQKSYFAVTRCKSGWDCMRHYEILANKCVPYFLDIRRSPENALILLPKDLLIEANDLYNLRFKNKDIQELTIDDINEYEKIQFKLFNYLKEHLTCEKMASYVLKMSNHSNAKKILYLTSEQNGDYMISTILIGLKKLYGKECHDFLKLEYIYKNNNDYSHFWGNGYSFTNLIDNDLHYNDLHYDKCNDTIEEDIKNKKYDCIIFGCMHRGTPFIELVNQIYHPKDIIYICGEDECHINNREYSDKGHPIFIRELKSTEHYDKFNNITLLDKFD